MCLLWIRVVAISVGIPAEEGVERFINFRL